MQNENDRTDRLTDRQTDSMDPTKHTGKDTGTYAHSTQALNTSYKINWTPRLKILKYERIV